MNTVRITDFGAVPGAGALQNKAIQAAFDACKEKGGTVIVPAGRFRVSSLRMWSDTTLYLEAGAELFASDICEDYEVYEIPEGVELRTDMELITQYYQDKPWPEYRRAILSVYGGKNIRIIGEPGSRIDGDDCCDPHGEEGFRGPHGIFITNAENVYLEGYTIANCGNFMHQIDNCRNVTMKRVVNIGASDGTHMHHCEHILIEDCIFHTGDDCIAGINMRDLTVRRCDINTSCQAFRAGGSDILVEDCRIWGPGIYPHRMTVVQNRGTELVRRKSNTLPRECGRHNLICLWVHFASTNFPSPEPYQNIVFRNCTVDNAGYCLEYQADFGTLQSGTHLCEMTMENVCFRGLKRSSALRPSAAEPTTVYLKNVTGYDVNGQPMTLFDAAEHLTVVEE